jgi:transposase
MDVMYTHCAGLDVHKKTVAACCMTPGPKGENQSERRSFTTMTRDLLSLSDWLASKGVTHVAMESTGEYWKPVHNILESRFVVVLANARQVKAMPGNKTDTKDAAWLTELLRFGLIRGSFIPPLPQRELRDLTRQRANLVQDRAAVVNQLQKVLEWANIKLAAVATSVTGVSARSMLEAILNGRTEPEQLAKLAKGRLRKKRAELEKALDGRVRDHHRFMISSHLVHLDFLDEQISVFDEAIVRAVGAETGPTTESPSDQPSAESSQPNGKWPPSWAEAIELLDTIPGVGRKSAEVLLAEIGPDMSKFPTAAHLASWCKVCPGNNESAGKLYSGKTGRGNPWLRTALVQMAHAGVKVKNAYLGALYRNLVGRLGPKKAIIAIVHRIIRAVHHMLLNREPWKDRGTDYLPEQRKTHLTNRLRHRLEELGYAVTLQEKETAA